MSEIDRIRELIAETDPYLPFASVLDQVSFRPNRAGQETAALGVGLGKAILAGILTGKSGARAAEQEALMTRYLPNVIKDPLGAVAPEGLEDRIANQLRQTYTEKMLEQERALQTLKRGKLLEAEMGILAEQPEFRAMMLEKNQLFPSREPLLDVTEKDGETPLDSVVAAKPGVKAPEVSSDIDREDLRRRGYTLDQIDKMEQRALEKEKNIYERQRTLFSDEDAFRTEIAKLPAVTQFQLSQKSLPILESFKDQDSKSSDVGFVYNYIKALDDGAVKEGEIDLANSANPLLVKFGKLLEGAFYGSSELTPELKNKMFRELKGAQSSLYNAALEQSAPIVNIATRRGFKEDNLLPFAKGLTFDIPEVATVPGDKKGPLVSLKDKVMSFGSEPPAPMSTELSGGLMQQFKTTSEDELLAEARRRGVQLRGVR